MAAQLEAARGLERGFLLSVSHDLRTPLTSIGGYAEAIADGAVEGADARSAPPRSSPPRLDASSDWSPTCSTWPGSTRTSSRSPAPVDAAEVVGEAVEAFHPSARAGHHARGRRPGDGARRRRPRTAWPDRRQPGRERAEVRDARVTVGVSSENGTLELRVDDDGPASTPATCRHVFERLYTSRTAPGRKVGTGLGLAIVHELSAAMGGTTDVRALDGQGTRFVVRIPAAH